MQTPVRSIVVPVDFSEGSDEAIRFAVRLATALSVPIELLSVVENPFHTVALAPEICVPDLTGLLEAMSKDAASRLGVLQTVLRANGVSCSIFVAVGRASTAIISRAEEGGFDLIVMGTHGRSGWRHALLGRVAERVLRHAPCPVLTTTATGQAHQSSAVA